MTKFAFAPTAIDLSRMSTPAAIEDVSHAGRLNAFVDAFLAAWAEEREANPSLPAYDVQMLASDPVIVVGRAAAFLAVADRQRVNDAVKALLAPLSSGTDLDNLVARQNVQRLMVQPATSRTPAVMETDAALLRRYLLSFDKPSAGSADRYLYEAFSAWPSLLDARVNGRAVHGRRGDTDIVIVGPGGRLATPAEKAAVSSAVLAPDVRPEAVSVAVLDAKRLEYRADLVIEVAPGPDASVVRDEAIARIRVAGDARILIGGEVPAGYIVAAAYGPNVIKVRDRAPVVIEPDAYTVPILAEISVEFEVRT